ncbi:hypothetical protein ACWKWC_18835 [Geodermatophilus nigrescens]
MATTLQHLLDDLTRQTHGPAAAAAIEDVTGALSHLGRALTGLTQDGLSPAASPRQQAAAGLAGACTAAGGLWPRTGGPLTDLAGAAADLVGRDRDTMGRAHRWAVTVELAAVADHCALLGRRLLPPEAAPELLFVRQSAVDVERDAQARPPTGAGYAVLDRLVPLPSRPSGGGQGTPLDAAASLVAAVERSRRADDLSLRDFRAAVAAAEVTSRTAAVVAGRAGHDAGPLVISGLAWQVAGRASTAFRDGRAGEPIDPRGVVAHARALADLLRRPAGDPDGDRGLRRAAGTPEDVATVLPALAEQLVAAVDRWSRTGRLYADARDLPRMEDMPGHRVRAVLAGRTVQAVGADLDRLRAAVHRATDLTAAAVRPRGGESGGGRPDGRGPAHLGRRPVPEESSLPAAAVRAAARAPSSSSPHR